MVALRGGIGDEKFAEVRGELEAVVARANGGSLDGPISLPAEYLRIVARKRG
jgi:hypothetical protein